MKINKILAASLIAAFGFTACAKDGGEKTDNGNKGVAEVVISFNKDNKNGTRSEGVSGNTTEAPASALESEVNLIEFFAFDGSNPDATTPYFRKAATSLETTRFLVNASAAKNFLVAVNANVFASEAAYTAAAATPADVAYEKIKSSIAGLVLTSANSQTAPATGTGFAMAAEGGMPVIADQVNQLSLTLNRVLSKVYAPTVEAGGADVSKIAVEIDDLKAIFGEAAVDLVGDVTGLTWTFDGYVVINGINNSYNFRYVGWSGWSSTGFNWNNTTYTDATGAAIATVYAGSGSGDMFLAASNANPVYIYENKPEANPKTGNEATTYKAEQVTGFIIKGHFNADVKTVATASAPRYWRVNLLKTDIWEVYRNSVYRVNMKNILTPGFVTPKEAEEDGPVVNPKETSIAIDLIIADWDLRVEDIDL